TGLSKTRYICAYEVAAAYASLGETDRAFEWFRKAVQDRSECLVWAKVSPWLDPVRSDPRFDFLLRQVGFEVGNHTLLRASRTITVWFQDGPNDCGDLTALRNVSRVPSPWPAPGNA